jgi:hypothetical protein
MAELFLALGICAALGGLAGLWMLAPETLLLVGFWTTLGGLALGIPTGALYHLELYRSLRACERLPERWWVAPISHHRVIPSEDRMRVLGWCYVGAAGFLVTVLGCALVALALLRGL